MNISPHLLIDAVILSAALTITLILRAKGNASRKEKEIKWLKIDKGNYLFIPKILEIFINPYFVYHL